jgi:hypothetical protein
MANITLEGLFDKISDAIIEDFDIFNTTIPEHQKVVRGGTVQVGRQPGEKLVLFDKDVIANSEDQLLNNSEIAALIGQVDANQINIAIGSSGDISVEVATQGINVNITEIVGGIGTENPLNVGQFIDFEETTSNIDPALAREFLDTNIFELLQAGDTRQRRINKFFADYAVLKGDAPTFEDINENGFVSDDFDSSTYSADHDISYAQECEGDDCPDEEDRSITRLNQDANSENQSKTLQWLRDDLNNFLEDIDEEIEVTVEDGRPEYKNKSEGYLKIRNLNQGIIVRKQEGDDIGIENNIQKPAGYLNPINNYLHPHVDSTGGDGGEGPSYLMDGLTITMWVRFLDRTSRGTLFNFGNPLRGNDPKGFRLETYVLGKDEELESAPGTTWGSLAAGNTDIFANGNKYERFIRLVVYDHIPDASAGEKKLYDSHIGLTGLPRSDNSVPEFGIPIGTTSPYLKGYEKGLLNHTRVPIDFTEWYFIVATYNPLINDDPTPDYNTTFASVPEYWLGNVDPTTGGPSAPTYTHDSGYGTKCKVEIISKSDLLRARGYKV